MIFQMKMLGASLKKNAIRYIVIFFTMLLTIAVMIASVNISKSAVEFRSQQFRKNSLNSQITIKQDAKNASEIYFDEEPTLIKNIKGVNNVKFVASRTGGNAYDVKNDEVINLVGLDISQQEKIIAFPFLEDKREGSSEENTLIINEDYATRNNLEIGDYIEYEVDDNSYMFKVRAICKNEGIFMPGVTTCVADKKTVQNLFGIDNDIYVVGVTVEDLSKISETLIDLGKILPENIHAEQTYDLEYFKSFVETVKIALLIVSGIFFIVLIYILFQTINLTISDKERQNRILWLNGIPKKSIGRQIFTENIIISSSSIIAGDLIAYPIIALAYRVIGVNADIQLNYTSVLLIDCIFLFCTVVFSIYLFYRKNKLNMLVINKLKNSFIFFISVVFIIFSYYMYSHIERYSNLMIYAAMIMQVFSVCVFCQFFVHILIVGFRRLLPKNFFLLDIFSNRKKILDTMTVILIIISAFGISFLMKTNIVNGVNNLSGETDYTLVAFKDDYDKKLESEFDDLTYIKQKVFPYSIGKVKFQILSIDSQLYRSRFSSEIIKDGSEEAYRELSSGRNIIISSTVGKLLKKELGDTMYLNGNEYVITAVISSFENMGKVVFISENNFDKDISFFSYVNYKMITNCEEKDVIKTVNSIIEKNSDYDSYIKSERELRDENNANNQMTFSFVNILIAFCSLICIIGISNNIYISMGTRRRSFAIKRVLGISQRNIIGNILKESVLVGLFGSIAGFVESVILYHYLVYVLEEYIGALQVDISIRLLYFLLLIGCVVSIISYCRSIKFLKTLNVINELSTL